MLSFVRALIHYSSCLCSSSNPCLSRMSIGTFISCRKVVELDYISNFSGNSSRRLFVTYDVLESKKVGWYRPQRRMQPFLRASSDDGVAVNGTSQSRASDDVEEMRAKLSGSLQDEYNCDELIQSLHDAARSFELALKKKIDPSVTNTHCFFCSTSVYTFPTYTTYAAMSNSLK